VLKTILYILSVLICCNDNGNTFHKSKGINLSNIRGIFGPSKQLFNNSLRMWTLWDYFTKTRPYWWRCYCKTNPEC